MKFDQHFAINEEILKYIAESAEIKKDEMILEIGAGKGNLTKHLLKKAKKVYAIEIDEKLCLELQKIKNKNLEIICANALEISFPKFDKLVANIPYSISEPLIKKLMHEEFTSAVIMFPESFVKKIISGNTKLSFIANLFFEIKEKDRVSPESFYPQPKVYSMILKIKPKKCESIKTFILQELIKQDSKKAKNALREAIISSGKRHGKEITKRQARKLTEPMTTDKKVASLSLKEIKDIESLLDSLNF